ncbi:hypothetical protein BDV23DRAFT_74149 [Aspergillus alliaceus]|uniref:Uncharacterized protein n=1 Tax=Petromyces alliaceus TaxID=209559 RepID=A0A5N7CA60_PETAA|nr:hypothetical protein BDV23DRAFT_74149 [Aspergillus alliaceus]
MLIVAILVQRQERESPLCPESRRKSPSPFAYHSCRLWYRIAGHSWFLTCPTTMFGALFIDCVMNAGRMSSWLLLWHKRYDAVTSSTSSSILRT